MNAGYRMLRCQATCVENRCDRAAHHLRDGFAVCRQHLKNQKFKPWPSVSVISQADFCEFEAGRSKHLRSPWPDAVSDDVATRRHMRRMRKDER